MRSMLCSAVMVMASLLLVTPAVALEISDAELTSALNSYLAKTDASACLGFSAFPRYAEPQESGSEYSISRYKPFIRLGLMQQKLYRAGEPRPAEDSSSTGATMVSTEYALFLTETGKSFVTLFEAEDRYDKPKKDFCYGTVVIKKIDSWVQNSENRIEVKFYPTVQLFDWARDAEFQNLNKVPATISKVESTQRYVTLSKTNAGWKVF